MCIHQYSNKESGLMIIGSATELRKLGEQLQALTANQPDFVNKYWPQNIASIKIDHSVDFSLSFSIDTKFHTNPPSNIPPREKNKTLAFFFMAVGFISIFKFILSSYVALVHIFMQ